MRTALLPHADGVTVGEARVPRVRDTLQSSVSHPHCWMSAAPTGHSPTLAQLALLDERVSVGGEGDGEWPMLDEEAQPMLQSSAAPVRLALAASRVWPSARAALTCWIGWICPRLGAAPHSRRGNLIIHGSPMSGDTFPAPAEGQGAVHPPTGPTGLGPEPPSAGPPRSPSVSRAASATASAKDSTSSGCAFSLGS